MKMREGGDYSFCNFVPFLEHQGSDSCKYQRCSSIPEYRHPFTSVPLLKCITRTLPGQWCLFLGAFSATTSTQAFFSSSFSMPRHFLGRGGKKKRENVWKGKVRISAFTGFHWLNEADMVLSIDTGSSSTFFHGCIKAGPFLGSKFPVCFVPNVRAIIRWDWKGNCQVTLTIYNLKTITRLQGEPMWDPGCKVNWAVAEGMVIGIIPGLSGIFTHRHGLPRGNFTHWANTHQLIFFHPGQSFWVGTLRWELHDCYLRSSFQIISLSCVSDEHINCYVVT